LFGQAAQYRRTTTNSEEPMKMKKSAVALVAVLIFALPLAAWAQFPKVGDPIVPFTLDTDEGQKLDSATLVGKGPLVLSFVNTTCSSCNDEMQDMKKFIDKNPGKVQYFPIIVDARPNLTVKPFKQGTGYTFTFLLDPGYMYGRKYGATYSPFTVVTDKDGKIVKMFNGYGEAEAEDLKKLIK
jgi:peroxiredoxin